MVLGTVKILYGDDNNPRFNLLKQEEAKIKIKTLVVTAGFDPLHDEGVAYFA